MGSSISSERSADKNNAMLQKERIVVDKLCAAEHERAVQLESQATIRGDPRADYCKPFGEAYQKCVAKSSSQGASCKGEELDLQACGVIWGASLQLACVNELHKARMKLPDMAGFEAELMKSYEPCVSRRSANSKAIFPDSLIEGGSEYAVLAAFLAADQIMSQHQETQKQQQQQQQAIFDNVLTVLMQGDPRKRGTKSKEAVKSNDSRN